MNMNSIIDIRPKLDGIEHFYNGSAGKPEKGLEISVIAVVDVDWKQRYPLSVQQTPPNQPESAKIRID